MYCLELELSRSWFWIGLVQDWFGSVTVHFLTGTYCMHNIFAVCGVAYDVMQATNQVMLNSSGEAAFESAADHIIR